jgi:hypothetical protein
MPSIRMNKYFEVGVIISFLFVILVGPKVAYSEVGVSSAKFKIEDRFGTAKVIGQVKNTGNDTVSAIEVGLTGYDKNGDVVMTATGIPVADSLAPNQKSSFETTKYKEDFEGMRSFELSLKWKASNGSEIYVDNAYNKTT